MMHQQPDKMIKYLSTNITQDLTKLQRQVLKIQQSIDGHDAELQAKKDKLQEIQAGIQALQDLERELSVRHG